MTQLSSQGGRGDGLGMGMGVGLGGRPATTSLKASTLEALGSRLGSTDAAIASG